MSRNNFENPLSGLPVASESWQGGAALRSSATADSPPIAHSATDRAMTYLSFMCRCLVSVEGSEVEAFVDRCRWRRLRGGRLHARRFGTGQHRSHADNGDQ